VNALRIIEPGFGVTVQDLGRPRTQHLGIPVSGVLDPVALHLANALVGNAADRAALEIRLAGPTLEVGSPTVRLALAGTRTPLEVSGAGTVPAHRSVRLRRGQRVRIGPLADSGSAVLAVEGGFDLPAVAGSLSTCVRARIGGLAGRALVAGDALALRVADPAPRGECRLPVDTYLDETGPVRVVPGPQRDAFTGAAFDLFLATAWQVTHDADRMGIRLEGPVLEHRCGHDIVSDGIVTGSVQVPGTGRPIILLADHQTTGGYPKIATVISADIARLGRLRPGDSVRFEAVSIEDAQAARATQRDWLEETAASLEPAGAWLDRDALYRENLISGVV